MVLRHAHIAIRESIVIHLISLSRRTHSNHTADLIFVGVLLSLIVFLRGWRSAGLKDLLSRVLINFLVIAILLIVLSSIPGLFLLSILLVVLILVRVRLHLVHVMLLIQSLMLELIHVLLLVTLLVLFGLTALVVDYLWLWHIVVLSVNLLLVHDLFLVLILTQLNIVELLLLSPRLFGLLPQFLLLLLGYENINKETLVLFSPSRLVSLGSM
jgi:hypothetical protein